ncbi:alpha/beta hydrolase [Actinobacteria bacterium YIM 96077]|uniref:Alpha/beta hydrolase n=1 Tax=Phytoactinopolyspora halophila TaxID=1981511 RepID=A0A329R0M2_9ACTN|nr:alpha/beta hydrolase [Phytoactinopolyspora halophila]AYY15183.1 alpha/beta hydrolase [Actinobacteria bacterium YIM 96077]RAW18145.1 alpha/beta hydrolase [Phytoactinopolyspora halophila]
MLHDQVEVPGPWSHRRIAANGAQFHVAELGDGPLILLLHGFPEFWWAWRHQLPRLAEAGWRAVAMDLRGFGGSDKPPRGYDPATFAADVTGVIRSIGERQAILVGHGWGAYGAWMAAAFRPAHVRALVTLSMPHPLVLRRHFLRGGVFRSGTLLGAQIPVVPERRLVSDDGAFVEQFLRRWAAPQSDFPDEDACARYRAAMRIWPAPHCALEYQRWAVRSLFRADGRRFAKRLEEPIAMPVLQVHGAQDRNMEPRLAAASRSQVADSHTWVQLEDAGHFPHEETPELVNDALVEWLGQH